MSGLYLLCEISSRILSGMLNGRQCLKPSNDKPPFWVVSSEGIDTQNTETQECEFVVIKQLKLARADAESRIQTDISSD